MELPLPIELPVDYPTFFLFFKLKKAIQFHIE